MVHHSFPSCVILVFICSLSSVSKFAMIFSLCHHFDPSSSIAMMSHYISVISSFLSLIPSKSNFNMIGSSQVLLIFHSFHGFLKPQGQHAEVSRCCLFCSRSHSSCFLPLPDQKCWKKAHVKIFVQVLPGGGFARPSFSPCCFFSLF